jgi:hypothetical protein
VLDQKDKDELQRRAKKMADDGAREASRQRFLVDDLDKAFRAQHGKAPQGDDLQWFDPGPDTSRKLFEQLATACGAAWSPKTQQRGDFVMGQFVPARDAKPKDQASATAAMRNVKSTFANFTVFVTEQIKQPLDLFRLLSWTSEPANPYLELRVRHAPNVPVASRAWSHVWEELYQDIATRGLYVALTRWKVEKMLGPRNYVGKDLQFILAPLKPAGRALLTRRLADSDKVDSFGKAQVARRQAKVWGDVKGLEIVDELNSENLLKEMIKDFETSTKAVLSRKIYLHSAKEVYRGYYSIFQTVSGAFTIVWIPSGAALRLAYVEVPAIPGVIFRARGDRVGLETIIEDKLFSDLAENAAALTQFLLFYLQVVGYVIDVITAGASGSVRVIVLRFIEERIKDKIVTEGLQLAGVDNPWVHTIFGMAAGLVPSAIKAPKVGHVKGVDELEHAAGNALRGGPTFKPKVEPKAPRPAPKSKAPSPTPPEVVAPSGVTKLGPRTELVGDSLYVIEKAPASEVAKHVTPVPKDLPKPTGALTRAKDYVVDVADRAVERVVDRFAKPAVAEAGAGGVFRTRLPAKGASPGVGGSAGRGTDRASKAVDRLRSSSDYKLLLEYEKTLMEAGEKLNSAKARQAIVDALERAGGGKAAEKEAINDLRAALNKAKGDAGEYFLESDLRSNFSVTSLVSIPTRGEGAPVLDVVVKLKPNVARNGGKRFVLGEAKGGLSTRLGEVTAKVYRFINGQLGFAEARRAAIRQASGEWYYQKFAEMFMMGQRIGGAEGKQMKALANELFDAARKGEVGAMIGKSNLAMDRKFFDSTDDVIKFFASKKWDTSGGFPIAK